MKVVVTGHKGYIGAVLVPLLLSEGHKVLGVDSDLYGRCDFGSLGFKVPEIQRDLRDIVVEDLRGFDAVIHLAALSNDPLGSLNPELTMEINYRATLRTAELAKQAGVQRFLFSSSCSMYGASGDKLVDESAGFNPVTPYALSKMLCERDLQSLADDSFSPTYLRNATVYGMSPRIRFDLVVNNLTAWACATKKVCLKSDGKPWRPLVHVSDVAHAFAVILNSPRELIHNEPFNVGVHNENYQIREVAELVRRTVPGSAVSFAADACADSRCYKVDFTKIYSTLKSYKPRWTVPLGVAQLYRAYMKHGIALEEFEGCRYKRIDHIKMLQREGWLSSDLRLQGLPNESFAGL